RYALAPPGRGLPRSSRRRPCARPRHRHRRPADRGARPRPREPGGRRRPAERQARPGRGQAAAPRPRPRRGAPRGGRGAASPPAGARIALGTRNIGTPGAALGELPRVLRRGGRLVVLEFSMPSGLLGAGYRLYFERVLPWIGGLVSGDRGAYAYLPASVGRFP